MAFPTPTDRRRAPRRLRARPDLRFTPQEGAGGDRYAVKDPVSLEYFYLRRREYFLLRELATPKTIAQLRKAYERRFPGERVSHDELLAFCAAMHRCSLLMPEGPGQAALMDQRAGAPGAGSVLGRLLSPLAIRLPGFDPTPLLRPLDGVARALFSRAALGLFAVLATLVGVLLARQGDRLFAELATLGELSRPEYAGAAIAALVLMKSWHEIGHGLAVRRFGGECHEMGVLLLALLPCLYCDASDAWSFRSRWRRAVVALAGVYFEGIAALLAAAAWLVLAPGLLSTLALSAAVIGTILTLVVNLNPLLRFDGYYLLADAWGVANLHGESRRALWGPVLRWVRGDGPDRRPFDASRGALALFAAAAAVHLLVVMTAVLWTVHRKLDAAGLRFAGDVLVATAVVGLAGRVAATLLAAAWARPFTPAWRPPLRLAALLGFVAAAGWGVLGIELEQSLRSPCRLEHAANATIAAPAGGSLVRLVSYDHHVGEGQPIARIVDFGKELELLAAREKEAELAARLEGLLTQAQRDAAMFADVSLTRGELAEVRRQRRTLERRQARLTLTAPVDGVVARPPPRAAAADELAPTGWQGAALAPVNDGCGVEPGDVLCVVGGGELHAVVLLRESDSALVRRGDRVRIALDRAPGEWLAGSVEEIGLASSTDPHARPTDTADVALESLLHHPLDHDAAHRVRVRLDPPRGGAAGGPPPFAQPGAVGQARILTGRETLAGRLARWARHAFHFE